MQFGTITDTSISALNHSRFIQNPYLKNEGIIEWLEPFGLSVSDILEGGFTTPTNFKVGPGIGEWYKDYTSGRSFQASFKENDGSTTTFVNKGNDIFEGGKYRRYHKEDGGYIGQELIRFLAQEYSTSSRIQEQALQQLGRPTHTTISLSVSRIEKTLSENGKIIEYTDYLKKVLGDFPEYKVGLIRMLFGMGVIPLEKIAEITATSGNDSLIQLMGEYPMGTYTYLIKGMNTRLVEHKRIGKNKLEFVLREEYPDCVSKDGELDKKKILEEFCGRLGENLGVTYSTGLTYTRESTCVLIDTTLGGVSMDNGHVGEGIEDENVISRLNELYSTVEFFNNNVLSGDKNDIMQTFHQVLIPQVLKNAGDNIELIKGMIEGGNISGTDLSKSFYMVNDFGNLRKRLKKISILGVGQSIIHLPGVKRNYFING